MGENLLPLQQNVLMLSCSAFEMLIICLFTLLLKNPSLQRGEASDESVRREQDAVARPSSFHDTLSCILSRRLPEE